MGGGKKKKNSGGGSALGRAIIRDRFGNGRGNHRNRGDPTSVHTSDLNDGYDWGRLNLQSVTEQSQLDEFLATAELAGTEFTAEKLNIVVVEAQAMRGLLTKEEKSKVQSAQQLNASLLKIPRRPAWDRTTSAEELRELERQAFNEWRQDLSKLQEVEGITLTPYEKNLEFWRQLWRVVERSDVVVQIVDARNPLLFRCADLEAYVREVGSHKKNLVLINKADFLGLEQRRLWARHFAGLGLRVAFFSALEENLAQQLQLGRIAERADEEDNEEIDEEIDEEDEQEQQEEEQEEVEEEEEVLEDDDDDDEWEDQSEEEETEEGREDGRSGGEPKVSEGAEAAEKVRNDPRLVSRQQLLRLLKSLAATDTRPADVVDKGMPRRSVVGLVGYPNVGKSSTINSLLACKKVSVSSTPGKTKHFQTINIDDELQLCDCPGLVMPSFVSTKDEMVIWGILPIDQMRDHVGPVNQVASLIPRPTLESTYGLFIPRPPEGQPQDRPPTSEELLNAYGFMRGFMTARGLPDNPRSSRYILKDFVDGKLLFCSAPPGVDQRHFSELNAGAAKRAAEKAAPAPTPLQLRVTRTDFTNAATVDQSFFQQRGSTAHSKGSAAVPGSTRTAGVVQHSIHVNHRTAEAEGKPWKKHNKRNRREKLRITYAHLDQ